MSLDEYAETDVWATKVADLSMRNLELAQALTDMVAAFEPWGGKTVKQEDAVSAAKEALEGKKRFK